MCIMHSYYAIDTIYQIYIKKIWWSYIIFHMLFSKILLSYNYLGIRTLNTVDIDMYISMYVVGFVGI